MPEGGKDRNTLSGGICCRIILSKERRDASLPGILQGKRHTSAAPCNCGENKGLGSFEKLVEAGTQERNMKYGIHLGNVC